MLNKNGSHSSAYFWVGEKKLEGAGEIKNKNPILAPFCSLCSLSKSFSDSPAYFAISPTVANKHQWNTHPFFLLYLCKGWFFQKVVLAVTYLLIPSHFQISLEFGQPTADC